MVAIIKELREKTEAANMETESSGEEEEAEDAKLDDIIADDDFFVNESLGTKLDLKDEEVRKQYRNSFDWFGFGLENGNAVGEDQTIANDNTNHQETAPMEEEIIPEEVFVEKKNEENVKDVQSKDPLLDKIKELLSSKQMKSSKIASELGTSKKVINQILYSHDNVFAKDIFFNWKLKK